MQPNAVFQRNFSIMVIGQVISLFGNAILRFALSLYVLDLTGSASIFGGILALAMIPTVLFSPMGGVLADRLPRQRIMVVLDFFTAFIVLLFALFFAPGGNLTAITILMILLALIQAAYQPSVQASIPSLVQASQLMVANGVVVQVQALATLLGPILGGVLYGYLPLQTILLTSSICFLFSAIMELFLRIPYQPPAKTARPMGQIKADLKDALHFLTKENPRLLRLLIIIAGINLFLSALFIIGLPYLIKTYLGLSSQLYGFAEAALGCGSILGGLLSGLAGHRIAFHNSHIYMLGTTILLLPIALVLALSAPPFFTYGVIVACVLLGMGFAALFNIAAQTFLQRQTPTQLLGKVGSFVTTICTCALPMGQAMYGVLFDAFKHSPWIVVLFGAAASLVLVLTIRKALKDAAE